ncbi:RagB/SusD family nutrient uptake outer membrane protein [Pedobacter heparinus]|uniref:RagB/SusD domain protein n=1 Tax=Pedobacter heparinus (strain ATCC 13125 / DSM 2366 / CIP 104194 / JCM 7457 / NBRC 12017 / NCIMB 9290 / NRRL B-14731 / HIM 762-3) TaxID=485917 RepID=C6Y2H7_PEDHD|nr:RagB/SusD family nutrient uptake outer membrane protein [Pedobacter heparinus]ACU05187.1 RagB/SusD domain protein [Pedobacter heparinus DSM 2366]
MKRIFFVSILAVLFACSKLDQQPKSTVGKEAVFQSEKGLELYATSFYTLLPTYTDILRGDNMSDYIARKDVPDFIRDGAYGPRQSTGWTWTDLRNINYFLENNVNTSIPKEVREHYNGLARFFRAWFYFAKVKRFGDVPWINRTFEVNDPEMMKGRDSRVLVMDSVLRDLDYATQHIRTTEDGSRSMITKFVAYAFKSRVCLFEGTFRKYHTNYGLQQTAANWLTEAATAAKIVMDQNKFSLYIGGADSKPYRELFVSKAPIASEVMLANIYSDALGIFHDANWYYTSATYGDRASFTRSFINTYLNIDGTPFTNKAGYKTMIFADEVENRDKRLEQTIRTKSYNRINGGNLLVSPPLFSYTYTGYQPTKWVLDDTFYDSGSMNNNIIPIFRYAEVLLNYAEAKAELGTLSDTDWNTTIGALRRRAGITQNTATKPTLADPYLMAEYFPGITDPSILEIRRERGIELALEGFRFYDLVRWKSGKLIEKTWNGMYVPALNTPLDLNKDGVMDVAFYRTLPNSQVPGVTYMNVAETVSGRPNAMVLSEGDKGEIKWLVTTPRVWQDKFYLYPIPESDRLMNPALGQNPDW